MKTNRILLIVLLALALVGVGLWIRQISWPGEQQALSGAGTDPGPEHSDMTNAAGPGERKVGHPTEPTPAMLEDLTTATAQITRGDGSILEIRSIDHEFDPLRVAPNEILNIQVVIRGFDATQAVHIEADNGGSLNQQIGPLSLMPERGSGVIQFNYSVGGNTGLYTLFLSQGSRQEFMELWAGPEIPVGESGPARSFNPKYLQSRKAGP